LVLNVSSAESLVQTTMVKKPQNLKLWSYRTGKERQL
jgi:hypothetical protein